MDNRTLLIIFFTSLAVIVIILSHRFIRKSIKDLFRDKKYYIPIDQNYVRSLFDKISHSKQLSSKDFMKENSFELAEKYLQANEFEKAEACFLTASENEKIPAPPKILRYLGKTAYSNSNFKKAIEYYNRLELIEHLNINETYELGIAHFAENNFKLAEDILYKAIKLNPNHEEYINSLLDLCLSTGKFTHSIKNLNQIGELSTNLNILKKITMIFETINKTESVAKIAFKIADLAKISENKKID